MALANPKVTLDYRHEWKAKSNTQADRLKTSMKIDPIILELEARTSSGDGSWLQNQHVKSYDVGIFYPYRYNNNLVVLGGFDYIMSVNNKDYVPSLRLNYKTDNGIRLQTRYKQILSQDPVGDYKRSRVQRVDFWLGYKSEDWDYQYQVSFGNQLGNDKPLQNNKSSDYWQNIRIRYQDIPNFRPYIEIGDVKLKPTSDERQMRFRVGIQYLL